MKKFILSFILLSLSIPAWANDTKESAYDRVMRTNTLRCAYFVYPPFVNKDLTTGKFTGVYPDIFNEIAKQSGLKIDWVEEAGSDTMFAGLTNGRYDAICSPITYTIARARQAFFTIPIFFIPFNVYVRADEKRFDKSPQKSLNNTDISFVTKDGDLIDILAKENFPEAKIISLPGLVDTAQLFTTVSTKKADAIVGEPVYAGIFMKNNPDKIKKVDMPPLKIASGTAAVPIGDASMLGFLNTSFQSLIDTGFINKTISKYIPNSNDLLKPNKLYATEK